MKILIFSEACFNDNIFPLFKAMQEKGHDVTCLINLSSLKIMLFNINKRIPKQSIIKASEYEELRIYENYMDMEKLYLVNHEVDRRHPWRELSRTLDVYKFIKKGEFDIIHTDILYRRAYTSLYVFRKKTLFIQHDTFAHTGMEFSKMTKRYFSLAHKLNKSLVILNKNDHERFCAEYNIPKSKVFVNKLGILDCITIYKDSSIKERNNNVLFFGRIVKYKGIEYLCEAMRLVNKVIPDATVTIAGSGKFYFDKSQYEKEPYFEFINRFIEEEELAHLIQQCSISICTYTDATQSGGLLTSFALNKPVIASDIETMKELIPNDNYGILVPPCDSKALAKAIIRLLQDHALRDRISKNIKEEYSYGHRSWSHIADEYINIYKESLGLE